MTYYTNIFENKKGEFYYSGILFHTQVDAETKGSKPRRSGSIYRSGHGHPNKGNRPCGLQEA
ncbi:hypothetical protein [Bradyrhizobium sp. STM 3557]|uniref:hypothetical protein n=1 Tax=Bradyrhizobium sp. STM 3557 TaxID=578920 RepID=UPI003891131E